VKEYRIINWIFCLLLSCLFGYILFLSQTNSTNLSIRSSCEGLPEALCKSRGLTRDFISLLQGNSNLINPASTSIFLFFVYAGLTRVILLILPFRMYRRSFLFIDITLLCIFFLYAFIPLL